MSVAPVSCCSGGDQLSSVEQALSQILNGVGQVPDVVDATLAESLGGILAVDVRSPMDVPGFDNSAMDGYAVGLPGDNVLPMSFRVAQRIAAGSVGSALEPGTAARIFTGAPIPEGTDAVIMQEEVNLVDDRIEVSRLIEENENIRPQGNDIQCGEVVLSAGQRLGPQHIALASSLGRQSLPIRRKLRVGLFFTGDELVQPGTPLKPGQIYNSNRYAINALLAGLGCEINDIGVVPDSFEQTCEALQQVAISSDLVVTTGGVSVGDEDHVRPAVEKLGKLAMWRVAMKPGKPLAFGDIGETRFVGLPGNPVAAFVSFLLFVRPMVLTMLGAAHVYPQKINVRAGFDWRRDKARREYVRVRLDTSSVEPVAHLLSRQGSDALSSLANADGLVEIQEGGTFSSGELITFIPFSDLLS